MATENAYQIMVTLDSKLPIWRRIVAPGKHTFTDLHFTIQDAMGWSDYHLHEFEVTNPMTGIQELIGIPDENYTSNSEVIFGEHRRISDIFKYENSKGLYRYDFGDNWVHSLIVEKISPIDKNAANPQCVAGDGACPPEDCGGISGYRRLLNRNLTTENTINSESLKEWDIEFKIKEFNSQYIHFRRRLPENNKRITENHKLWLRQLIQGKINLDNLKLELGAQLPQDDITKLNNTILEKPIRYRNRAICVLSSYKGIPQETVSEYLFIPKSTVKNNFRNYSEKGLKYIISEQRKYSKKYDDPKYIDKVFSIIHAPPSSYGFNRTTWKQNDILKVMSDGGLMINLHVLGKIIKQSGYKYRKAKIALTSNDPEYKEKIKKIKSILSTLRAREKFFSIDEYGPFAIKMQGGKSLVPAGTIKTVPQWQKSKGSIIVTAALELSTNQITHFYSENKNTAEMIKLLNILIDKYSDQECIYFSWDAASWHASKELQKRVDEINSESFKEKIKSPLVKLAPLPTCAQFLNVIESVFSGMARAIIHNSDYQSIEECKSAIDRHFVERNEHFRKHPKRAGNKIWGKERVKAAFSESNNCKDPMYR